MDTDANLDLAIRLRALADQLTDIRLAVARQRSRTPPEPVPVETLLSDVDGLTGELAGLARSLDAAAASIRANTLALEAEEASKGAGAALGWAMRALTRAPVGSGRAWAARAISGAEALAEDLARLTQAAERVLGQDVLRVLGSVTSLAPWRPSARPAPLSAPPIIPLPHLMLAKPAAPLPVAGPYRFANSAIAAAAIRELKANRSMDGASWNGEGQCIVAVQRWVNAASLAAGGGLVFPSNTTGPLHALAASGAVEVPASQIRPGDVVQEVPPGTTIATDSWERGPIHTYVVVAINPGPNGVVSYSIVQRNVPAGSGAISNPTISDLTTIPGDDVHVFRFGQP